MNKFITTAEIIFEIEKIIKEAKKELILVSPFIKLDKNYRRCLNSIKEISTLKITVVYGKNERNQEKSLNADDFDFLSDFPNVEIRYIDNLHGKYYANENKAIITSMNLYDYSKNNTEFGILLCRGNKKL
jgi:hypothetical protein